MNLGLELIKGDLDFEMMETLHKKKNTVVWMANRDFSLAYGVVYK